MKRCFNLLILAVCFLVSAMAVTPADARDSKRNEINNLLAKEKKERNKLKARINKQKQDLSRLGKKEFSSLKKLRILDDQLKVRKRELNIYNYNIKEINQKIARLTKRIDEEKIQRQQTTHQQPIPGGTGFLFSSKDYVITNHHLVRGRSSIKVTFLDGEVIDAKVVSVDKQNDIAFLKLSQSPKIPPSSLQIADSSTVKLGDKIFTIGYPASHLLGKSPKYSEGVINSIKGISDNPAYFQISVPIQPGNSGGPLFNVRGEVIGITTSSLDSDLAKDAMGAVPQNINYAVKSLLIKNLMPTIPDIMVASRGIVVVPTEPENNLSNFIENVQNNIVLIEAKE